jgi:formylglycine-generating enzyme required for sulfatase activity
MQSIPGGTLWMGSPEGRGRADERPRHKLQVQPFCLDAREVTVEAYQSCVRNTICAAPTGDVQLLGRAPSDHEARSRSCTSRLADNATLPMNCIGHDQAHQYCSWKGRRLPSEAEWEWARPVATTRRLWLGIDSA